MVGYHKGLRYEVSDGNLTVWLADTGMRCLYFGPRALLNKAPGWERRIAPILDRVAKNRQLLLEMHPGALMLCMRRPSRAELADEENVVWLKGGRCVYFGPYTQRMRRKELRAALFRKIHVARDAVVFLHRLGPLFLEMRRRPKWKPSLRAAA